MEKYLRRNGMISESEYKGLTLEKATKYAEDGGFVVRIVEENGQSKMLDMSVRGDRVNFRVLNGIIIGVYTG